MMDETGTAGCFKQFALELYGSEGVAAACLYLQNQHVLDVNIVLFAAFIGAERRQTLTTSCLDAARTRVDAWHREVVQPLRVVRQRLKTGPAPAPNEVTTRLRGKLQQIEIDAELIELDQLAALIPLGSADPVPGSPTECATAAIEAVVRTYSTGARDDSDQRAIETIAAAAVGPAGTPSTGTAPEGS
jgi:uncharacterized protein (TIGR02444 family)